MNVWAVSSLPVYTDELATGTGTGKKGDKKTRFRGFSNPARSTAAPVPAFQPASEVFPHHRSEAIDELLEPAVDGPPSPESIREQMRQASVREKHQSHQTTSSGSSSLRSLTSADRPSWENGAENRTTLSRKSSGRSTSSSMPSRERPESVQIFGKTLFNRRGRLRRESSAQSSSASSLYSADASTDALVPSAPAASMPSRDSTMPTLFSRRRPSKQDQHTGDPQRKIQISGPYNFQHVTHTQREHLPDLQRTNRAALASEFSQMRVSQAPAAGALRGIQADDLHFEDFSSESLPLDDQESAEATAETQRKRAFSRPPSVVARLSPRRLKHSKSQDQIRIAPPRPPRSPPAVDRSFAASPPIPPPRVSSRMSVRHERFGSIDRPQTSTGSFYTQSFPLAPASISPPTTSHGYVPAPDMGVIPEDTSARIPGPCDDENWPLPCPSTATSEYTLPEVPEEEDDAFVCRPSRASLISNASLRGSQSVPMLRRLSILQQEDESGRRPSGASDTLGRFNLFEAQRSLEMAMFENSNDDALPRESWEDDIDYCYEHAAEADCDYEWDRPSLDLSRDGGSATPVDGHHYDSCEVSPTMLTPAQFDVPSLSPVSQVSAATANEAITPTVLSNPKPSNFSLPRVDTKNQLHVRQPSDASSFREAYGFTLSPSLLVPMDYQQQMKAMENDVDEAAEFAFARFDGPSLNMDTSALLLDNRASSSTTVTFESARSNFEKHNSTTSTSTDFTRLTLSTSSLEMDSPVPKGDLHRFPSFESAKDVAAVAMPTLSESEEHVGPAPSHRRGFSSRGSESNLDRLAKSEPWPGKRKDSIPARRGRARTTSLSTPPPPNQYALFPSVQLSGNRI